MHSTLSTRAMLRALARARTGTGGCIDARRALARHRPSVCERFSREPVGQGIGRRRAFGGRRILRFLSWMQAPPAFIVRAKVVSYKGLAANWNRGHGCRGAPVASVTGWRSLEAVCPRVFGTAAVHRSEEGRQIVDILLPYSSLLLSEPIAVIISVNVR
jgi:hypothetical protein